MKNELIDILSIENRNHLLEEIKSTSELNEINNETELYAFFADPADHSLSPLMYNTSFRELGMNRCYFASCIPDGGIRKAMVKVRTLGIKGVNISMPHKQSVIGELDEIDELAELCEAVNTVVAYDANYERMQMPSDSSAFDTRWRSEDSFGEIILKGYNTDALGAAMAIKEMGIDISGKDVVLFGLGGAGKAVLSGLAKEGAKGISVFVRSDNPDYHIFAKKISNYYSGTLISICNLNQKELLRDKVLNSHILVNCTNVGMGNLEGYSIIPDESYLHKDLFVMDAIYSPSKTRLLEQAESAGCKNCINGLPMLINQGVVAFELYTGEKMPVEIIRDTLLLTSII